MRVTELARDRTMLSFEIFPPKPDRPVDTIYKTLDGMKDLKPDFISVTYGAGGGNNKRHTFQIASDIKKIYGIESVAHLSCMGLTRDDLLQRLEQLRDLGIDNILALKGNPPAEPCAEGDFPYASDMVSFIKAHGDFTVLAACYPEGHIECGSLDEDIRNLKIKVDAGADHLITQLFLDNLFFYSFMDRIRAAGISVPVEAGIMPVVNSRQIQRMATLCGVAIPRKFAAMMEKYGDKPEAMRDAGIAYATDQIVDLIAHGVDGIHLYTMNNPYVARKIYEAVRTLI